MTNTAVCSAPLSHTHTKSCADCRDEAEKSRYVAAKTGKDESDNEACEQSKDREFGASWLALYEDMAGLGLHGHHLGRRGRWAGGDM